MGYVPYSERVFVNKKVLKNNLWCQVCDQILPEDVLSDPEWGCGRCVLDDYKETRTVLQIRVDDE